MAVLRAKLLRPRSVIRDIQLFRREGFTVITRDSMDVVLQPIEPGAMTVRHVEVDYFGFTELMTTFRKHESGKVLVEMHRKDFNTGMTLANERTTTVLRRRKSFDDAAKALLVERGVLTPSR